MWERQRGGDGRQGSTAPGHCNGPHKPGALEYCSRGGKHASDTGDDQIKELGAEVGAVDGTKGGKMVDGEPLEEFLNSPHSSILVNCHLGDSLAKYRRQSDVKLWEVGRSIYRN